MVKTRLYISFIYLLFWLVLAFKWIPEVVVNFTTDPTYKIVLTIGISGTLLIPLYLLFALKK